MFQRIKAKIKHLFFNPFPKTITQKVSGKDLTFIVHNPIEEDRVAGGNNEIEFTQEILHELTAKDVYFDIGSCIGFTAISAAATSGCTVYAFEPDIELAGHFRKNVSLNKLEKNIHLNQWAVSDTNGTIDFFTSGANGASPALAKTQNQNNKVTVKTYSLDSALKQGLVQTPSVVKIDIEGAELMALKGMESILSSDASPRTIFIETHPGFMIHFKHSVEMLQQYLHDKNYTEVYCKKRGEENHHKFVKKRR